MELQFLVNEVMDEASKKHGRTFSSKSEAYADILEEYQECFEELENIDGFVKKVWNGKRNDNIDLRDIESIKKHALLLAEESLQVAGLCDKYTKSVHENIIPKIDLMNKEEFLNFLKRQVASFQYIILYNLNLFLLLHLECRSGQKLFPMLEFRNYSQFHVY